MHTPRDVKRGVLLCLWWIEIQNKDDDKVSTILLRMRNIGAMFDTLRPGEEKPKDSLQCVNVINGEHVEEEVDEMKKKVMIRHDGNGGRCLDIHTVWTS